MQEDASCSETSSPQKGFCGDVETLPALLVQHCNFIEHTWLLSMLSGL
jgi:hypothetical protein